MPFVGGVVGTGPEVMTLRAMGPGMKLDQLLLNTSDTLSPLLVTLKTTTPMVTMTRMRSRMTELSDQTSQIARALMSPAQPVASSRMPMLVELCLEPGRPLLPIRSGFQEFHHTSTLVKGALVPQADCHPSMTPVMTRSFSRISSSSLRCSP